MSIASKTARKSAGQQAPKEKVVLTTEFAIKEIRVNRAAKLAVLNVEYIDKLLADYDRLRAELILARAGAADFENQLTNERNDHKDTQAELAALLEKIQPIDTVDPDMEKLSAMLTVLAKYEIIEGNTWGDDFWGAVPYQFRWNHYVPEAQRWGWNDDNEQSLAGRNWLGRLLMVVRDVVDPES